MPERSTGTVTFLFTDIEGSTALLRDLRGDYGHVLAEHQRLLRAVFESHGGEEIDTQGDAFLVAFRTATDAVRAAVEAQRALAAHDWPDGTNLQVRVGIHTGEARVADQRYVGLSVHRGARVAAAAHGGQILITHSTYALLEDEGAELPDIAFRNLGEHRLKDFDRRVRLYQVLAPGVRRDFPRLRTAGSRRRRRTVLFLGGALLLLAALAAGAAVLVGGGEGSRVVVKPNSRVKIDPRTNRVASVVKVGSSPGAVVYSAGSLWVLNEHERTISLVDPETGHVTTVPAGFDFPCCLAADGVNGGVRVSGYGTREVKHVDAITALPDRAIRLDELVHRSGDLVRIPRLARLSAVGGGSLWLLDPYSERVRRVSLRTGRETAERSVGPQPFAVDFGNGSAWVSNYEGDSVLEIRASDEVGRLLAVPGGPVGVAVSADSVWVNTWSGGKVRRLEITTGETTDIVDTGQGFSGDLLADIALGFGAVWATFVEDAVMRIDQDDPDSAERIELGHRAGMIAVGAGAVWVTVQEPVS